MESRRIESRPCSAGCGSLLGARDLHTLCIACLGVQHAQEAAQSGGQSCVACSGLNQRIRNRRLHLARSMEGDLDENEAAQEEAEPAGVQPAGDTLTPSAELEQEDWGSRMDALLPLEEHLPLEGYGGIAEAPYSELEELLGSVGNSEPVPEPFPSLEQLAAVDPPAPPPQDEGAEDSVAEGSQTFFTLCRRASTRLDVPWPSPGDPAEAKRSIFKGKVLAQAAAPPHQLLPLHPDFVAGLKSQWNQPQSARVPVRGFTRLEADGLKGAGLAELPSVEPEVQRHLSRGRRHPAMETATAANQRVYKASSQVAQALNAVVLLSAYQAELLADLEAQRAGGQDLSPLLAEIRAVQDHTMAALDGATQATGRTMAVVVAAERKAWLDLTSLPDKVKTQLGDAPVNAGSLFGPALTDRRAVEEKIQKEGSALQSALPRKFTTPLQQKGPQQSRPQAAQTSTAARGQWQQSQWRQPAGKSGGWKGYHHPYSQGYAPRGGGQRGRGRGAPPSSRPAKGAVNPASASGGKRKQNF